MAAAFSRFGGARSGERDLKVVVHGVPWVTGGVGWRVERVRADSGDGLLEVGDARLGEGAVYGVGDGGGACAAPPMGR